MKHSHSFQLAAVLLAILGFGAGSLQAAERSASWSREMELRRTPNWGEQYLADGLLRLEAKGNYETFDLRVFADLPDGTQLIVKVQQAHIRGPKVVGVVPMVLGSGILQLNSFQESDSYAFPVREIQAVFVWHDDALVLWGRMDSDAD